MSCASCIKNIEEWHPNAHSPSEDNSTYYSDRCADGCCLSSDDDEPLVFDDDNEE